MFEGPGGAAGGRMAARGIGERAALDEPQRSSMNWRVLARIFAFTRPYAAKRNLVFLLTAFRSFQRPAMGFLMGWVVNSAIMPGDLRRTLLGAAGLLALAAFTEGTFHFRQRAALELSESVVHDLRERYFAHLQLMTLAYFQRTRVGSILSRMISDIENVRRGVQQVFFGTPMHVGMMTVSSAMMLWQNAALFGILATIAPIIAVVNRLFHGRMSGASRAVQRSQSRLTGKVAESVCGIRVIQSHVQEEMNLDQYSDLVDVHAGNNVRLGRNQAIYMSLIEFNSQAFLALLLAVGGYGAVRGWESLQASDVIAFFFLANHFFNPLQQIGRLFTISVSAMAGAERIFGVLDEKPDWSDAPGLPVLPRIPAPIDLHHVTFGYRGGQVVLDDVSLTIRPGTSVALVGATGSGKTTLANLIAKFYLPRHGRVLVGGRDLATCDTASWRKQISVVPQRNFLFTGTVFENIRLGRLDATEDEVLYAAAALDCLSNIESLPQGLKTPVGENGHTLSLGMRQLICFVRAWLANPNLLILDEATSAIDTLTEAKIQRALKRLLAGRTSIIIAHRLSTIRDADMICVLEAGRIIERGTHDQLVRAGGPYMRLHDQFVCTAAGRPA